MKNAIKLVAYASTIAVIVFTSCDKEDVGMITGPITIPSPPSPQPIDSTSFYRWNNYDGSGTGLWAISGFGDVFKNIVSKFDSAFYDDHVKVKLKFADSAAWVSIPYVAHDHTGQTRFDVYFTDNNYIINLGPLGSFSAPRIIVLAKPTALIDFSKPVAVKIVVN
jgi:hypothetical protein